MFNRYPFLRYAVFFAIGIILQDTVDFPLSYLLVFFFGVFAIFLSLVFVRKLDYHLRTLLLGISGLFLLTLSGAILVKCYQKEPDKRLYQVDAFTGTITDGFDEASHGFKTTILLDKIKVNNRWLPVSETIVLFYNSPVPSLNYGDRIVVKGRLATPKPAMNPGAFDYQLYLKRKGIYAISYVKQEDCFLLSTNGGNPVSALSIRWRKILADYFHHLVPGKNEASIATALVLGVKGKLDDDLRDDYANSGTLHVLAVSGMHVGLIYAILAFIFGWLKKYRSGHGVYAAIIIVLLILYAMLTGLSASVLRAVAMCCLIVLAEATGRRSLVFNTVFLSAFILLCLDPYIIYDVGFQLSYAAVMGIICWQKPLYEAWEAPNKVADWLWQTLSVTLTAQLAVAPLGLLYFYQFPNLFWFANMIVIPASTIILFIGLAMLLCWPFIPLAALLGKLIAWSIDCINIFVHWLNSIPFAVTDDVFITPLQTLFLYGAIVAVSFFVLNKKKFWSWPAFACLMIFTFIDLLNCFRISEENRLIIPYSKNVEVMLLHKGFTGQLLGWDLINSQKVLRKEARILAGDKARSELLKRFYQEDSLWAGTIEGKKIVWLKGKTEAFKNPVETDLLIVSSNAIVSLKQAQYFFNFKEIVIHPNYSYRIAERLTKQAAQAGVKVWNMHERGYYKLDFH